MTLSLAAAQPVRTATGRNQIVGNAKLLRLAFQGADLMPIWTTLMKRALANPRDAAALYDMSVILQAAGQQDNALRVQRQALSIARDFHVGYGSGSGLDVLALVTPGNFMANTPVEFLLEGSDMNLTLRHVDADTKHLGDAASYDVIIQAVGESETSAPVLDAVARCLADVEAPVINRSTRAIAGLCRDGLSRAVAHEPSILSPPALRLWREAVAGDMPFVIRPAGSHAGQGLERIESHDQLRTYLASQDAAEFFVSPFVDYKGPDGYYRKQRIAFIDGRAFASHMAVSPGWMVHYLNAGMTGHANRRGEEQHWMEGFDAAFAVRHADAFAALRRLIGLDYFIIDCAEMPDGRLLLFEADVAMIVHDMDPEDLFPYKKPAMRKLFAAFQAMLQRRAARQG